MQEPPIAIRLVGSDSWGRISCRLRQETWARATGDVLFIARWRALRSCHLWGRDMVATETFNTGRLPGFVRWTHWSESFSAAPSLSQLTCRKAVMRTADLEGQFCSGFRWSGKIRQEKLQAFHSIWRVRLRLRSGCWPKCLTMQRRAMQPSVFRIWV